MSISRAVEIQSTDESEIPCVEGEQGHSQLYGSCGHEAVRDLKTMAEVVLLKK